MRTDSTSPASSPRASGCTRNHSKRCALPATEPTRVPSAGRASLAYPRNRDAHRAMRLVHVAASGGRSAFAKRSAVVGIRRCDHSEGRSAWRGLSWRSARMKRPWSVPVGHSLPGFSQLRRRRRRTRRAARARRRWAWACVTRTVLSLMTSSRRCTHRPSRLRAFPSRPCRPPARPPRPCSQTTPTCAFSRMAAMYVRLSACAEQVRLGYPAGGHRWQMPERCAGCGPVAALERLPARAGFA